MFEKKCSFFLLVSGMLRKKCFFACVRYALKRNVFVLHVSGMFEKKCVFFLFVPGMLEKKWVFACVRYV